MIIKEIYLILSIDPTDLCQAVNGVYHRTPAVAYFNGPTGGKFTHA